MGGGGEGLWGGPRTANVALLVGTGGFAGGEPKLSTARTFEGMNDGAEPEPGGFLYAGLPCGVAVNITGFSVRLVESRRLNARLI